MSRDKLREATMSLYVMGDYGEVILIIICDVNMSLRIK